MEKHQNISGKICSRTLLSPAKRFNMADPEATELHRCTFVPLHIPDNMWVLTCFSLMVMIGIKFGGLLELAKAVENYRENIKMLCGNQDQYVLAPKWVLQNITMVMYSCYIDLWPINSTCVGHRSLLMYSMLEFAMLFGRYWHLEWQLSRHQDSAIDQLILDWLLTRWYMTLKRTDAVMGWNKYSRAPCSC